MINNIFNKEIKDLKKKNKDIYIKYLEQVIKILFRNERRLNKILDRKARCLRCNKDFERLENA